MTRHSLLALLVLASLALAGSAAAQNSSSNSSNNNYYGIPDFSANGQQPEQKKIVNQYSNKYKNPPMAATHSANGILPQRQFQLFFVRTPQSGPQEATLRLLSPFSLDGCVDITPPVVEQEQKGKTLWYTVSDPGITLQAPSAQKTQGCRQNARYAFADITFDRDNLQKQDIRQIAFKAGTQVDYYDLAVSDRNITLMPKSATAFQPRTGLLTQWFYPASMVILYVPSAKDQPDIARKVAALAQSHGMVDAEKALPGFHQPMADRNNFYFLDKKRAIVKTLTAENSQIVGTIEGEETFFGPHGPYQRPKMMDVFARRPGTND